MRARDLAADFPAVRMDTSAREAARLLAVNRLPGLIVVDERDRPVAVLPGSQVLRSVIPRYVQDDPALARVYDEGHADKLCAELGEKTVAELLPSDKKPPPVVDGDATVMEIASLMAGARSPVVAVVDDGPMIGAVTVSQLFTQLLPAERRD